MPRADEDRRLVLAGADELDSYLDSSQLLWRLSDQAGSLTPGSLLLALKCLNTETSIETDPPLKTAIETITELIQKRQAVWQKRIAAEFPYRLRLWKASLEEYFEDELLDHSIASQIKNRVLLELLKDEARMIALSLQNEIEQLDRRLKPFFNEGSFLWDTVLTAEFDASKFWYLYLRTGEMRK